VTTDDALAALMLKRKGKPGVLIVTLKACIREVGVTQTVLSTRSGVSNAALSRCLRGESDVGYSTLEAIITKGLGVKLSDFFLRLESLERMVAPLEAAISEA
jgi:transcriptional regulator with XRE-family HTH domain